MTAPFTVHTAADLDQLIGFTQQHAPHRVPLLQAVRHGIITLCELTRDATLPAHDLARSQRPKLVLVGDDDGLDSGPDGWTARPRLAGWARHAVIHATGGDVPSYLAAVTLALHRHQLVLVETGTTHCMAWHRLFARSGVPTLNLVPPDGGVHPVPIGKEGLH